MKHGNHGRDAIDPLKSESDIDQHRAERDQHHIDGLLPQIGADMRADDFDIANRKRTRIALLLQSLEATAA